MDYKGKTEIPLCNLERYVNFASQNRHVLKILQQGKDALLFLKEDDHYLCFRVDSNNGLAKALPFVHAVGLRSQTPYLDLKSIVETGFHMHRTSPATQILPWEYPNAIIEDAPPESQNFYFSPRLETSEAFHGDSYAVYLWSNSLPWHRFAPHARKYQPQEITIRHTPPENVTPIVYLNLDVAHGIRFQRIARYQHELGDKVIFC